MSIVLETVDVFPFTGTPRSLRRQERLLLAEPIPGRGPVKLWQDLPALEAAHFDQDWAPVAFAAPRGVYESRHLRLEWQTMNFRQPFYHRNADVDEMSFQIAGERTLMTELGTVEHLPGDFSRIPRGVAHDNYGRQQSHLLFYVPAPAEELQAPTRSSAATFPPFPGWTPGDLNELTTECLGGPEHDVAISPIDEQLLLDQVGIETDRINIVHPPESGDGTTWVYRSRQVLIGRTNASASQGREYRRHLDADEIQYQIKGRRTLVTQRGSLEIEPGDFVRIPVGCAYTSIHAQPSSHVTVASAISIPQAAPVSKKAEALRLDDVERLRQPVDAAHHTERALVEGYAP